MEQRTIKCQYVIAKNIRMPLVASQDSFSFVGGVDIQGGEITDYRHGNYQQSITDKAFAFPFGRGSSGAGLVLMEMVRLHTAPGALINVYTDPVILTGPLICKHFYDHILPVVNVAESDFSLLLGAKEVEFFADSDHMIVYL